MSRIARAEHRIQRAMRHYDHVLRRAQRRLARHMRSHP